MLESLSGGEQRTVPIAHDTVLDALGAQWATMKRDERAFLIYCLQRLRMQRDTSASQRSAARASGRDSTGAAENIQNVGTSPRLDSEIARST